MNYSNIPHCLRRAADPPFYPVSWVPTPPLSGKAAVKKIREKRRGAMGTKEWERKGPFQARGGQLSSNSPPKFLLAISTETMVRMSTLVVLLRTSDRKLAFYAAIALKATELIIVL